MIYFLFFLLLNIIAFVLMYLDKQRAIRNEWRIPEKTLLLICVLGGFLGTFLAMKYVRHKTKHWQFHFAVILATLIWVIGLPIFYFFYLPTLY